MKLQDSPIYLTEIMMNQSIKLSAATLGVATLCLGGGAVQAAPTGVTSSQGSVNMGIHEVRASDSVSRLAEYPEVQVEDEEVRATAEVLGVTYEEAQKVASFQPAFADAVEAARNAWPDQYAGAEMTGPSSGVIRLKGEVPTNTDEIIRLPGVTVEAGANISATELMKQQDELHTEITKKVAEGVEFAIMPDSGKGDLTVEFDEKYRDSLEAAVAAYHEGETKGYSPSAASAAGSPPAVVNLEPQRNFEETPEWTRGGGQVNVGCSAAFTGYRNGNAGIITAGHCFEDKTSGINYRHNTGAPYVSTYGLKVYDKVEGHDDNGYYGDYAFFHTNTNEWKSFWASPTSVKTLSVIKNPIPGNVVCVYGQKTAERKCSEVTYTNVSSGAMRKLVRVKEHITQPGDSGAGWSYGTIGYGVHRGSIGFGYRHDSIFSSITYIDDAIGVHVAKN